MDEEKKVKSPFQEIIDPFIHMIHAPRALWALNISYLLEGLVYFGILTILTTYLNENLHLSDHEAGLVVGFFTCGITLSQLFLGGRIDKWGVRKGLWTAMALLLAGRIVLAASDQIFHTGGSGSPFFFMVIGGLFIVALAYGLYMPGAYAAVRQFTNKQTAAMGYALLYGLMNLGAFFSGILSPNVRKATVKIFPPNGLSGVLWVYVGLVGIAFLILLLFMNKKSVKEAQAKVGWEGMSEEEKEEKRMKSSTPLWDFPFILSAFVALLGTVFLLDYVVDQPLVSVFGFVNTGHVSYDLIIRVLIFIVLLIPALKIFLKRRPDHPFKNGRFVFFIFILIPVQTLFAHNWLTLPLYIRRAYPGFVGNNFEFFSNINPILIFVLTPLVAALTSKVNVYKMMILGTFVMAAPTFLLSIGPYPSLLLTYILLMSVGEAMWQPRFLQYIAEIAPKGQTGIYMGIGQFPWFLTKMITGFYSGWFIEKYCPAHGVQSTGTMWFIYALIAISSPVALLLAKRWMAEHMQNTIDNNQTEENA